MSQPRRQHSAEFKFRVALEAATGLKTISELASEHAIHPNLVRQWKSELMEKGTGVFSGAQDEQRQRREQAAREMELYEQIGRLKMDLEWVKKTTVVKLPQRIALSVRRGLRGLPVRGGSHEVKKAPTS